jgi:hypothetical protein
MNVSELYGRHRGEEIWIAGSDPSLTEYPDDFFDDKIGITLHLAHRKFPDATWRYSSEYDRSAYLMSVDPSYIDKRIIVGWPVYGKSPRETAELFAGFREVYAHRMRSYPPTGVRGEVDARFTDFKVASTAEGRSTVWGAHGTCLHNALYMAILMGAKAIHIIGAGHGMFKSDLQHFAMVEGDHHKMRPGTRLLSDPVERVPQIEQILAIKAACEKIGISLAWHRTWAPAMDDFIAVDPAWLAEQKRLAHRDFALARRLYWAFWKRPLNRIISRR